MILSPKEESEKERDREVFLITRAQEEKKAQDLAAKFNLPYINLLRAPVQLDALSKIPEKKSKEGLFLAFELTGTKIGVATTNPDNNLLKEVLAELQKKGYESDIFVCSATSFKRGFEEYKKVRSLQKKVAKEIEISPERVKDIESGLGKFEELEKRLQENKKNTTFFIETLLASALKFNSSDVHIVPENNEVKVRYRIDGILHDIISVDNIFFQSILSRVKLLSELKINIHDIAQDGRFSINLEGKEIEIRVSVIPGEYGEDIVMRILDPNMLLSIEDLGFYPWHEKMILEQMKKTIGLILTCGPTGSGKTTTLYACLKKIAKPELKILTIENPIEYHLENVDQTQIDSEKGYDFAKALRAALRQDPDVMLVGEIRDSETANTAMQAASTGHLVFSTLHTNDAAGIVPRLIGMGIDPASVAASLNLAISQRLLRRACNKCSVKKDVPDEIVEKIKINLRKIPKEIIPSKILDSKGEVDIKKIKILEVKGCEECFGTGYRGRVGVYEMFKITPKIEEKITMSPSIFEMRKTIIEEGMVTTQQDGLLKVIDNITTIEELERVTGPLSI